MLDLERPGLSGIGVTLQLRAEASFAEMPIILLTSHAEEDYAQAGWDAGANAYVVKPFSPQELAARVDELLGRR